MAGPSKADIAPELDAAYRDLWDLCRNPARTWTESVSRRRWRRLRGGSGRIYRENGLCPSCFSLLDQEVKPDPDYGIFRRLPSLAADHPEETLRVVEKLADDPEEPWTLQVHENEIRQVLEVSIHSSDDLVRARAEALVHRLGRIGTWRSSELAAGVVGQLSSLRLLHRLLHFRQNLSPIYAQDRPKTF